MNPERRRYSRKRNGKLTYIHLEGNGAIILDASEGGLGFHAAGPIEGVGPIEFNVSLEGRKRAEIHGEVMWTDASRRTGGLRFVDSPAASSELRIFLERLLGEGTGTEVSIPAAVAAVAGGGAAASLAAASVNEVASAGRVGETPAAAGGACESPAAASVSTAAPAEQVEAVCDEQSGPGAIAEEATASVAAPTTRAGAAKKGGRVPAHEPQGVSAIGVGFFALAWLGLFCWMGAAVFVWRHPVGHSLVQIGEWLAESQQGELTRTIAPSQRPARQLSAASRVSAAGVLVDAAPDKVGPAPQQEPSAASPSKQQFAMRQLDEEIAALEQVYADDIDPYARRARRDFAPAGQPRVAESGASGKGKPAGRETTVRGGADAEEVEFKTGAPRGASALLGKVAPPANRSGEVWLGGSYGPEKASANPPLAAGPRPEPAPRTVAGFSGEASSRESPSREDADSINDTYFDVGRYKGLVQADEAAKDLSRLGLQTTVVRRRVLWMEFFHVVVGPYRNHDEADTARGKLEPMGLQPRYAGAPRESAGAFRIP